MQYYVANKTDHSIIVVGLGLLEAGETHHFDEDNAASFRETTGLLLNQSVMPEGAELTIHTKAGE
jgi:hypothetical protein